MMTTKNLSSVARATVVQPEPRPGELAASPPPAGQGWLATLNSAKWLAFLGRFALLAVVMDLAFWLMILLWFLPATQPSPLSPAYADLIAATRNPAMYRIAVLLDLWAWLQLGILFIALAALLIRHAPIRSVFIAACGVGQTAGLIGAFMRHEGLNELATTYMTAGPAQQTAVLRAYLNLAYVINGHFDAGALLWATGFLLVASATWSQALLPRWLTILIALPGLLSLITTLPNLVSGIEPAFVLDVLSIFLQSVVIGAMAVVFWRRGWTFPTTLGVRE